MRLLTVSHFFEGHGGGIERVAGQLCRQFTKVGVSAAWAASDADDAPVGPIDAVPLRCVNPTEKLTGLPMPIPGFRGIRTLSQQVRVSDAVIIHDALYVTSIVAMLMAKRRRKRTVLIQHIAAIPFSSPILRAVMKAANLLVARPMLWAADERVFISQTVREHLLGSPRRHTSELLFNGVDGSIFSPAESGKRRSLPIVKPAKEMKRVLFVGRYVEKKGLGILRALAKSRPDCMFVLAGTGPIKPSAWRLENVQDIGPQKQDVLANLYRWADLLILPSVGEGFPLVIQEAMACGLPVICGTPADRADPEATKWLRGVAINLSDPERSAGRCADAIDGFKLSDNERTAMARYALQHYDWSAMAHKLITLAQNHQTKAR